MNPTELSSSELLRLARAGDAASVGALLSKYGNYMEVITQAQLDARVRRRVSSSDVVQETMLEAHRDFEKFSGSTMAEFTGWLRKILINNLARTVETHLLAAKRDVRQERSLENADDALTRSHLRIESMLSDHARSPASEADHQEALVEMANAIANLPAEYREVIVLRHVEGLPFSDVAERMKRTPGAARMLWMRAIERLRETMN
ncbi:sigma-70 family RNA polymerase sigma factor [Novipirellula sp. SH528]|uniref:sigma-70 family RNA polymerase sigma factor n=1 Tax=Novipirellula sp. SH528 TaxID=3454466 RepID=UPI003FA06B90